MRKVTISHEWYPAIDEVIKKYEKYLRLAERRKKSKAISSLLREWSTSTCAFCRQLKIVQPEREECLKCPIVQVYGVRCADLNVTSKLFTFNPKFKTYKDLVKLFQEAVQLLKALKGE